MKLKLLALLAYAAYEYDKNQVSKGKESIFAGLGDFVFGKNVAENQNDNHFDKNKSVYK